MQIAHPESVRLSEGSEAERRERESEGRRSDRTEDEAEVTSEIAAAVAFAVLLWQTRQWHFRGSSRRLSLSRPALPYLDHEFMIITTFNFPFSVHASGSL